MLSKKYSTYSQSQKPLSPHLSIYKPQINSLMSIIHRFTGISLFFGFSILSWWLIFWIFSNYNTTLFNILSLPIIKFNMLLLITFLVYHFVNGIRHLLWDIGLGYSIDSIFKTSYLIISVTVIISGIIIYLLN